MIPVGMATMNMSMFGVALPTVRDAFAVEADMAAWLLAAYSLPFVIFMPLYGKLGDSLGKARLFQSGIVFFFAGSVICVLAGKLAATPDRPRSAGNGHGRLLPPLYRHHRGALSGGAAGQGDGDVELGGAGRFDIGAVAGRVGGR